MFGRATVTADSRQSSAGASPYATGGGGTRLEHRLGAVLLAHLLTGSPLSELDERPLTQVAFQQSTSSRVDDLVVTAAAPDGVSSFRLDIAVRRTPKFVRSHKPTNDLMVALVAEDIAADDDPDERLQRRLAVAVSGPQTHAQQVAELAVVARAQPTADEFFRLVLTPGRFATRGRLEQLRDMVEAALPVSPQAPGAAEYRCWSLLRRLWIMQIRLETGHDDTWTGILNDLQSVAVDHSLESARGLRDQLEQLVGEFATNAAVVDATALRQRLHGRIAPTSHVPPSGWARLMDIDRQTRAAVVRSVVGRGETDLKLERVDVREAVQAALTAPGDLVVTGESGVGKSALLMDAIEQDAASGHRQTVALNLRGLPDRHVELLDLLMSPLSELLAELTAPERILVLDGAEASTTTDGDVLTYLTRVAREAGVKVVATSTTEGAATVIELMRRAGAEPRELLVPGLGDDELREVAREIPSLQRLVDNPRSRELLRRPIVIDLLCRSSAPGLPLSESQALEHIWHHLVRNENRHDAGEPEAREQAMLSLADHSVCPGNVDDLQAALNSSAIDGLRRSGLLAPASTLPWERLPAFQHDLVRAYALARLLLADRDPATALIERGAPRWTLPAARLACEILLEAPGTPAHPLAGRLSALQQAFEALAENGHGQRWRDVPLEAVVGLPDARGVLSDAWPTLIGNDGGGISQLIRVLRARHQHNGILDAALAEPVVAQLLEPGVPRAAAEDAAALKRDWLRAHSLSWTAVGQPTRIRLRDAILQRCADNERALDEAEAERRAELAARTAEQVAADEERARQFGAPWGHSRRRRRRVAPQRRPYEWIADAQIEHLALLGADLGQEGEAVLRRIAEDDPFKLVHAVEVLFAGQSLAAHSPQLLLGLVEAYYIEEEDDGWDGGMLDDGIRDHRSAFGGPLASYLNGPFLAMFRADFRGGVAALNRMLDHAARFRDRRSTSLRHDRAPETAETLAISGGPREYAGDANVWHWYRGTGSGPYPCMSALQALEFVTEELIDAEVPIEALTAILTADAHNLAMPALALAILVRHMEDVGEALDPYLVEPVIWELEFSRAINDQVGLLAARVPALAHPERRTWSLRDVSAQLALRADGERVRQLQSVGEQLVENARRQLGEDASPGAAQHLASVRNWARGLDPNAYQAWREGDHVVIQQAPDPEIDAVLQGPNADLSRSNDAIGLVARHAQVRETGGRAPDVPVDVLRADLTLARDLIDNPPQWFGFSLDGPAAVAATALELHLTSRVSVAVDDLVWSAKTLVDVAAAVAERSSNRLEDMIFGSGADRSAARALPLLLLPTAHELRTALPLDGADELLATGASLAIHGDHETRLAYARALDDVWAAPCDLDHLAGRCHHRIAFDIVIESARESAIGPWNQETQERELVRLDLPVSTALDAIPGEDIYVRRLNPGLRAAGAAAVSDACCADDARVALRAFISAHQRAMLASEHGSQHSASDSLVAARSVLRQTLVGDDETTLEYVRRYLANARLLAEGLDALGAAAEERVDLGQQARRLWAEIMDIVLDAVDVTATIFTEHTWGKYARASLIPTPSAGRNYLTGELNGDPEPWRNLLAWVPQVDRWARAAGRPQSMSLDHLVVAVRELDVPAQIEHGLAWIEAVASGAGPECAWTYLLPEWLRERRPDLTAADLERWQRVVDFLVVAGDTRVADLAD